MIIAILLILIVLWLLGYLTIPGLTVPRVELFSLLGRTITLWDVLIFLAILAAIGFLPSPFREIVGVLFLIWVLATLGVFALGGLASWIVIAIILGLIVSIFL